jgi:hypothetical protein
MKGGVDLYPTLTTDAVATVSDEGHVKASANETTFIEFDYNFVPNSADLIHFNMSSELGAQYFLDYGRAEVDLKLNTLRWYGLSAPLRDMYPGDYMFEQANPLVQIRLFNKINPELQTGAVVVDWTLPFNNTNTPRLDAGLGYSLTIGNKYYPDVIPDEGTANVEHTAVPVADREYTFPKSKMLFNFYHEITRALLEKTEEIAEGGRDFGHRFIYETGNNIVPAITLAEIPLGKETGGDYVIVGNPLMSHIDFEEFYDANKAYIQPRYSILSGGSSYITYSLDGSSTDPESKLSTTSIPPMQTFIVELIGGHSSADRLFINKGMDIVNALPTAVLRSSTAKANELRINVARGTASTEAIVVLSETADNAYVPAEDSRRLITGSVKTTPNVFTIVNNTYLDINQVNTFPESLPIGIIDGKGKNTITITGLDHIDGHQFSFLDTEVGTIPIDGDVFEYTFDNPGESVIGRFFLRSQTNVTSNPFEEMASNPISVSISNKTVYVMSLDGSSIEGITIFGIDGQVIYQQSNIAAPYLTVPVATSNTVLLVKVRTNSASTVAKIINK